MKYLPGRFEKYIVNHIAKRNKASFLNAQNGLIAHLQKLMVNQPCIRVKLVSFSGKNHKPDQLYSLASFYINVGLPAEWLIISDGTYDDKDKLEFESLPAVKMVNWYDYKDNVNETLLLYGKKIPFGKRLHAYINQPFDFTTIFTDTDILFFPAFKTKIQELFGKKDNWFLNDHGPAYMEPYYWQSNYQPLPNHQYLNAGFIVINRVPHWQYALDYISNRSNYDDWGYLTEQVAINIMFSKEYNNYPLSNNDFVFNNKDCFHLYHAPDYKQISLRHFAGRQARVKMWQLNWKKLLMYNF